MAFSFLTPLVAFIDSIPSCVMGGVCISLYGFIAVSGLKMLQKVDLGKNRNLFTASIIFISGIGGLYIEIGDVKITTIATALILGILTNTLLARSDEEKAKK
jgi:uracil permease